MANEPTEEELDSRGVHNDGVDDPSGVQLFPPDSAAAQFLECLVTLDEYVANTADEYECQLTLSEDDPCEPMGQEVYDDINTYPSFTASWQVVELGHNMLIEYWAMKQAFDAIEDKITGAVADLILPPSAKAQLIVPTRDHLKKGGKH